jgi:hypothetical protein
VTDRFGILAAAMVATAVTVRAVWGGPPAPATPTMLPPIALPAAATLPVIAVNRQGEVFVAWTQETRVYTAIYVQVFRGGRWEALGSSANGQGISGAHGTALAPSLAIDSRGNPAIAWQDLSTGNDQVYFRHWDGASWGELDRSATGGGVSNSVTLYARNPSLALDAHDSPVLSWEQHYGSRADLWTRRHIQSLLHHGWQDFGSHPGILPYPDKLSVASHPMLRLNASGEPSLAWMDTETGPEQVYFRRWASGRWEELAGSGSQGGVSRAADGAASVNLELNAAGNPILSWKEGNGPKALLRVKQWDGRQWIAIGDSPSEAGVNPTWPCLAIDAQARPVIAYRAGKEICVRRWNSKSWDLLGSTAWRDPSAYTLPAKRLLALAANAGKACVAWIEADASPEVRTACFTLGE